MTLDLRTLFLVHSDGLRQSLTRRYGDPALAADLVQDAFLRLAQAPSGLRVADMRSYLGRIARNLALNHFRQIRQRRTSVVDTSDLMEIADEQPSPEAELEARRRLDRLRIAMKELPELTQRIFMLTRVTGMTYTETARELGISESSVQKHLARALLHAMHHAS